MITATQIHTSVTEVSGKGRSQIRGKLAVLVTPHPGSTSYFFTVTAIYSRGNVRKDAYSGICLPRSSFSLNLYSMGNCVWSLITWKGHFAVLSCLRSWGCFIKPSVSWKIKCALNWSVHSVPAYDQGLCTLPNYKVWVVVEGSVLKLCSFMGEGELHTRNLLWEGNQCTRLFQVAIFHPDGWLNQPGVKRQSFQSHTGLSFNIKLIYSIFKTSNSTKTQS